MTRILHPSNLTPQESSRLFGEHSGQVPLHLRAIPGARVLWLNRQAMKRDPQFAACGGSISDYERHLLRSCAYEVVEDPRMFGPVLPSELDRAAATAEDVVGYADRYGGSGLGGNGGGGRAAFLNGYYIKGVGRTPLLGRRNLNLAHSSGCALMEEAVRDVLCSELAAAEFPYGAVRTLAIIGTGKRQSWDLDEGTRTERRCLIVRSAFARPAHWERAPIFLTWDPHEGAKDAARAAAFSQAAREVFGPDDIRTTFRRFWLRWAEQLAYGLVHRVAHAGLSTSNICLDGSLVDFGAMASLPSWAHVCVVPGMLGAGDEANQLLNCLREAAASLGRYVDPDYLQDGHLQRTAHALRERFETTVAREVLRLAGVPTSFATDVAERAGKRRDRILRIVDDLFRHWQREGMSIVDGWPVPLIAWDFSRVWAECPPSHLKPLRDFLSSNLNAQAAPLAARRCEFLAQTRPGIFRGTLRHDVFEQLEKSSSADHLEPEAVTRFICSRLESLRRDSRAIPDDCVPVAFEVGSDQTRCIVERGEERTVEAIAE